MLTTLLFLSLDGVVEAEDDWQFPYFDEEMLQGFSAQQDRAAAVLLGRRTFEGFQALRGTHPESPVVAFLGATPKFVVSRTLTPPDWGVTEIISGDLAAEIAALKERVDGDLLLLGSPALARWTLGHGLLDELALTILPIVVGAGPRLFEQMDTARVGLRLERCHPRGNGVLDVVYRPD
jgi:dihydrofolate reductase